MREAADEGYDVVVAFGGDGTLNEAANGLAGTDVPLTHLPGGSTNVFCKMLGSPARSSTRPSTCCGSPTTGSHGRSTSAARPAATSSRSAGFGLDASVIRAVDLKPALKHRYGEWYFTWSAVRTFFRHYLVRPPRVVLETDAGDAGRGSTRSSRTATRTRTSTSRPLHVAEDSSLDNGEPRGRDAPPSHAVRRPDGRLPPVLPQRLRMVDHRQITGFSGVGRAPARSTATVPLQVDGDWVGDFSEVEFSVRPGALTVIG